MVGDRVDGEAFEETAPRRDCAPPCVIAGRERAHHGSSERIRVVRWNQHCSRIIDDIPDRRQVAHDDRTLERHCFKDGPPEPLAATREREHIGCDHISILP